MNPSALDSNKGPAILNNDFQEFDCRDGGGPIISPPFGNAAELGLVNADCRGRRLSFEVRNNGRGRSQESQVFLIDESDRVVEEWDVQPLFSAQFAALTFRRAARREQYRLVLLPATDDNLGNNFIVVRC